MPANNRRWVALSVLVTVAVITFALHRYGLSTLAAHHQSIRDWLGGEGLYTSPGAVPPPALAVLLTPLTLLPVPVAGWLLALAGAVALTAVALVVAGPVARRYGRRRTPYVLGVAVLALLAEPVRATVGLGRPELLVLALIAADLVALRRAARNRHRAPARHTRIRRLPDGTVLSRLTTRRPRPGLEPSAPGPLRRAWTGGAWAGVGTGLATALSATSLLFIAYLVITRQRRAAGLALVTTAVVGLGLLLTVPTETLSWYGHLMWEIDRPAPVSDPGNQSLAGVMARLYGYPAPPILVWFSFVMLLLAVGLIRARTAHADGDEVAAFTLIGLTAAVIVPVSTSAERLWLLPAVLILADSGLRRRRRVRLPRSARFAGAGCLLAATLTYLIAMVMPSWSLAWNIPALTMILLINILPSRHATPPMPTGRRRPQRRAAIPMPRGG
ncbi:glycosyltransferase 87 family protein [Actinoplanes sp. G11-F43]|uniref:glycosyltransferase 87 family protein n=1 Tax=Actinoplanes sp. G11-F43 TaxID=3424130 RepID=UPI003D3438DD